MSDPTRLPVLFVAALAGALGIAIGFGSALWFPDLHPNAARSATDAPHPTANAPVDSAPAAMTNGQSLVALGETTFVQALPGARLALFQLSRDADANGDVPPRVLLQAIYALREDWTRHRETPEQRAPHGHYLDDLGREASAAFAAHRAAFESDAQSERVEAEMAMRLETHGRALLVLGDAWFLLDALKPKTSYQGRRAAAFVLGEAGYMAACPQLAELLGERGDGAARARALLDRLTGRRFEHREAFESYWRDVGVALRFAIRKSPPEDAR